MAMIGTRGRSRATRKAVVPLSVKQQITLIFVVSAISRAAATIPSATDPLMDFRLASMMSRYSGSPSTDWATLSIVDTASIG